METEDYRLLELLLGKLRSKIDAHNFCIIPEYIQDGVYMGAYNIKGELIAEVQAINIKECVLKLNIKIKE